MATLDIFKNNAFSLVSMLQAIREVDYLPQRLGGMGVFTPNPVRTETVGIEKVGDTLALVKTSPRGSAPEQATHGKRDIRPFNTLRIADSDRITASELANIRAFGTESEFMQVQAEIARRLAGPAGLQDKIELTLENMRLGAIQGIVKDADGSTLFNWFDEFDVTQPTEIDFDLDAATPASGVVRKKCNEVIRAMKRAAKGVWTPRTYVHALCGDRFWDDLTAHSDVQKTFLNTQEASSLRQGNTFQTFAYGGIIFENYQGTDDGVTVGIDSDKAKFFPVNAPGAFLEVFSPGEQFQHIGQLGERLYPLIVPDRDRNMYADIEVYSYPLHICTRPQMLLSARRT